MQNKRLWHDVIKSEIEAVGLERRAIDRELVGDCSTGRDSCIGSSGDGVFLELDEDGLIGVAFGGDRGLECDEGGEESDERESGDARQESAEPAHASR